MKTGKELINEINTCQLSKGQMAFWWLGQLGYAMKLGNTILYIDAYLSDNPDRNIPPLLKPEDITNADYILGSHDHEDHIDRPAWKQIALASPKAKFVVSELLRSKLSAELDIPIERFLGLDDQKQISLEDLVINGIAAAHEFLDQDKATGIFPYLGFVIEGNGCVVYHSGDCCIYPELLGKLKQWSRFDAFFLPINGRDAVRYQNGCIGNMTYQEAVDLAGSFKPGLVTPGHYEMFSSNSENPMLFQEYLNVKYPGIDCWIGQHGEMVLVHNQ